MAILSGVYLLINHDSGTGLSFATGFLVGCVGIGLPMWIMDCVRNHRIVFIKRDEEI
jgi:hypothetical protein